MFLLEPFYFFKLRVVNNQPLYPEVTSHTCSILFVYVCKLMLTDFCLFFIRWQTLEERDRRHLQHKDQLNREQRFLRRKLEQLADGSPSSSSSQMNKRRGNSLSECSTSTNGSSASSLTSSVSSETGIAAFYGDYTTYNCFFSLFFILVILYH